VRHLAIGDIHGCFTALATLAATVPFQPEDLLITLGDYVDRGPDSRAVLEWLRERYQQGTLIPLRGNHEIMMLQARESAEALQRWLSYGGTAVLASYARPGTDGSLADIPASHWQFLEEETRAWYETSTHFFVHANAYPDYPLQEQPDYMLYWEKFHDPPPHASGKIMICGHTPQKAGTPRSIGHAICLDTWVYGQGWLTCLDVQSGQYWQANQQGATRTDWLSAE
jgi:serine/threonine protein phosphatase 1